MIGNAGTGKTSLLLRFTDDVFSRRQNCTVGVDIKMKVLKVDNKTIKLQIWDTAG
jgi:small GTP-binding protein